MFSHVFNHFSMYVPPGRCDCTLTSMIQRTAFPESHSAFTMDGLLRGIAHLHAQRIVHRSSVMLGPKLFKLFVSLDSSRWEADGFGSCGKPHGKPSANIATHGL